MTSLIKDLLSGADSPQLSSYIGRFKSLFVDRDGQVASVDGFRGLLWASKLDLLPPSVQDWTVHWSQQRVRYSKLKDTFLCDKRADESLHPSINNPLSQDTESPWNQYFLDGELRKVIERDVVRTSPGSDEFKKEDHRTMMTTILFIYAKEHPLLLYRQGMHELLAGLLLVWRGDVTKCTKAYKGVSQHSFLRELLDENYIESDIYCLFERIMDFMWDWYYSPDSDERRSVRSKPSVVATAPFENDGGLLQWQTHNNAVKRLHNMWVNILQLHDKRLYDHLHGLHILPTTFGTNWTKLLFSRQFSDYLPLWDAVIDSKFTLVDYLVVAMVLAIRSQLFDGDSNLCNSLLVAKYPSTVRPLYVIHMALHLQNHAKYPRPEESPYSTAPVPLVDEDVDTSFELIDEHPGNNSTPAQIRAHFDRVETRLKTLYQALGKINGFSDRAVRVAFDEMQVAVEQLGRQLPPSLGRRRTTSIAFEALSLQ